MKVFFTQGVGVHAKQLQSFEYALRDAGMASFNLVEVSSILPPHCEEVSREEGLQCLQPGQIVFTVIARNCTNEGNRLVSASIGVAKPTNIGTYGYLSEHHSFGETEQEAGDFAEDLAASMLASTLGIPFDVDAAWDERHQIFRMSGQIVDTRSITACASGVNGKYTTTVALAVFIMDN
jgi:arginine decarboxylase